ncbi:MAG: metallophosphoesterase [candidate division WOR-3 bacterium]|nr:metallophosphoesterase [candidate division WOR-3 bacterium]
MKILNSFILILLCLTISAANFNHTAKESIEDKSPGDLKFIILGDSRNPELTPEGYGSGDSIFSSIIQSVNQMQENPAFIIHSGDLAVDGESFEYKRYLEIIAQSDIPVITLKGNHEIYADSGNIFFTEYFGSGNTAFEKSGITFIGFNTVEPKVVEDKHYADYRIDTSTLFWMDSRIRRAYENGNAVIPVTHVPPCIEGKINGHCLGDSFYYPKPNIEKSNVYYYKKLIDYYGIAVSFYGHIHSYGDFESNGHRYVISGGAGAPLYDKYIDGLSVNHFVLAAKKGDSLFGQLYDENGNMIDRTFKTALRKTPSVPEIEFEMAEEGDSLIFNFPDRGIRYVEMRNIFGVLIENIKTLSDRAALFTGGIGGPVKYNVIEGPASMSGWKWFF